MLGWYNLQRMYPLLTHVSATNNTCIRIDKCCLLLLIIVRDTSLIIVNVSSLLRLITLTSVRALLKQKSHVRGLNPQPRALMPPGREYCYGVVARSACMPAVSNGRPAMYCLRYNTAERLYPSLVPRYSRTPALFDRALSISLRFVFFRATFEELLLPRELLAATRDEEGTHPLACIPLLRCLTFSSRC